MLLVAYKPGQLANQLFVFAHLVAFAAEHHLIVVNPSFDDYCKYFEHLDQDLLCRFPQKKSLFPPTVKMRRWLLNVVNQWISRFMRRPSLLPNGIKVISIEFNSLCYMNEAPFLSLVSENRLIVLRGWCFRDVASFNKHADIIRDFFAPKAATAKNVDVLVQACRNDADIIVGVHIRRGDYKEFINGRYFFEAHQYRALMHQMTDLLPGRRVLFLICSNEAVSDEAFHGLNFRVGNNHVTEDMYALAACDYILGPPSTFSHWASFYGKVPLYKIIDPDRPLALNAFKIADGNCDMPEFLDSNPHWDESEPLPVLGRR